MDPVWIALAFALGFVVKQAGLPPLVGFLAAGFVLNGFGVEGDETLELIAEKGVLLLLFSVGLKLRVRRLLRPQGWAAATLHMVLTVALLGALTFALALAGLSMFGQLDLGRAILVAFAMSFSSTVFTVKVLEEKGEMGSSAGRIAIGILVMQDLFAVLVITVSTGKVPSPWAVGLLALPLAVPFLRNLLERAGHGELLLLLGVVLAFGASALFAAVGLKGDLGALVIGALLAGSAKAEELSKALLGLKDLLLVGFFLTIGLAGLPDWGALACAAVFVAVLPLKVALFFVLLTRFKVRARTATLASLSLATYSEFGLIVGNVATKSGWLDESWLVVFALSLSATFVLAAPLNTAAHAIYERCHERLRHFETAERLPEDAILEVAGAEMLVFGMGTIGAALYDDLVSRHGDVVVGIDVNRLVVAARCEQGRRVLLGDAADSDFWERLQTTGEVRLMILTMGEHAAKLAAAKAHRVSPCCGTVAAIGRYDDEARELTEAGVDAVYNLYAEAGLGFARHIDRTLTGRSS